MDAGPSLRQALVLLFSVVLVAGTTQNLSVEDQTIALISQLKETAVNAPAYATMSGAALFNATGGACSFLQGPFEDMFNSSAFDPVIWDLSQSDQQDHCPSPVRT